jgi:hypothetical protein
MHLHRRSSKIKDLITALERDDPPLQVEFPVTACHAMRGSGSSEINERGALLSADLPGATDLYHRPSEIKDLITELRRYDPPLSVEFPVTACHAKRGSGSSEINVMERGVSLSTDCDDWTLRQNTSAINRIEIANRGFQHLFKGNKTTSSQRVLAAHRATVKHGAPGKYFAKRRGRQKRAKINKLQQVMPSPAHALDMEQWGGKPLFFSGTSQRTIHSLSPDDVVLSAIDDMKVIDTMEGARMESANGDIVFVLVPRRAAIKKHTHLNRTFQSLHALKKAKRSAEKRGKKRITVPESYNSNYFTVGLKPNRNGGGVIDSWPRTFGSTDKDQVIKLMNACQEVADGYIRSEELRGIRVSKDLLQWSEMQGSGPGSVLPSFSAALNTCLCLHTDEDFFYSVLMTASTRALKEDIDQFKMDADVSNYFVFAEQGIAVAVRPGDILVFNPKYHHCSSSRALDYENEDVFSMSLYLKSAVVGKFNNTLPLNETEMKLLEGTIE